MASSRNGARAAKADASRSRDVEVTSQQRAQGGVPRKKVTKALRDAVPKTSHLQPLVPREPLALRQWLDTDDEEALTTLTMTEMAGGNPDLQQALDDLFDVHATLRSDHGRRMTDNDMDSFSIRRLRFLHVATRGAAIAAFIPVKVVDNYGTLVRAGAAYDDSQVSLQEFYELADLVRLSVWSKDPLYRRAPYLETEAFVSFHVPFPRGTLPYGLPVLERRVQSYSCSLLSLASLEQDSGLAGLSEEINHADLFRLCFNSSLNNHVFLGERAMPGDGYPRVVVGWQPHRWGKTNSQQTTDIHSSCLSLCVRDPQGGEGWSNSLRFLALGSCWPCPLGLCHVVHLYGDVATTGRELLSVLQRHLLAARDQLELESERSGSSSAWLEFQVCTDATAPRSLSLAVHAAMTSLGAARSPLSDVIKRMYVWERDISRELDLTDRSDPVSTAGVRPGQASELQAC